MDTMFVCGICGDEFTRLPMGGYCDDSMACVNDDGENLLVV